VIHVLIAKIGRQQPDSSRSECHGPDRVGAEVVQLLMSSSTPRSRYLFSPASNRDSSASVQPNASLGNVKSFCQSLVLAKEGRGEGPLPQNLYERASGARSAGRNCVKSTYIIEARWRKRR
jgi:hypothetical protein